MTQEVKPSFSWKYLVLTLITALIISAVGLGVSKLYQSRPLKEIVVYDNGQINMLNDEALPTDQIEATYYLKGNPKKKIESLFLNLTAVKNAGNEGIENLLVTFNLKEDDAFLISPIIKAEPKGIIDAISITKKDGESTDKKHVWNISLLNPGESVIFEYTIYSQAKLKKIEFSATPRKKDWSVLSRSPLSQKKEGRSSLDWLLVGAAAPILFMIAIFIMAMPIYRFQWNRRPDYREQYGSFIEFYMRLHPGKLFNPPDPKKETANNAIEPDRE
jgi:hypothetical protein